MFRTHPVQEFRALSLGAQLRVLEHFATYEGHVESLTLQATSAVANVSPDVPDEIPVLHLIKQFVDTNRHITNQTEAIGALASLLAVTLVKLSDAARLIGELSGSTDDDSADDGSADDSNT